MTEQRPIAAAMPMSSPGDYYDLSRIRPSVLAMLDKVNALGPRFAQSDLPRITQEQNMQIVLVHVHVKPEFVEAFKQASIGNASNSVKEPGIARFDVIQQADDPTKFILVEIYKTAEAQGVHKETAHYATWRDTVAEMMAEPRQGIKYTNIFPADGNWQ